jgi:hypothetical protein
MAVSARWIGVVVSLAWILAVALLSSRNETWIAAWRLYCYLTADSACGTMVYIVVHWPVIAEVMLVPVIFGWLLAWGLLVFRRPRES